VTPTVTPSNAAYYAYVFPEPQDFNDGQVLENYMTVQNPGLWGGYQNYGVPDSANPTQYSDNLDLYAHFSGFTGSGGNYKTAVNTLTSLICQLSAGCTDTYSQGQNQYTFGTVAIPTSAITTSIQYFYSIWLPLNGLGGSMTNMSVDAGVGSATDKTIANGGIPDVGASGVNVVVTSGAAIPAGTYRVLWLSNLVQPLTTPATLTLFIKGNTKT
jgi:hypothetical protein